MNLEAAIVALTEVVARNNALMEAALAAKPATKAAEPEAAPKAAEKPKAKAADKPKAMTTDEFVKKVTGYLTAHEKGTDERAALNDLYKAIAAELGVERLGATPAEDQPKALAWIEAFVADGTRPNFMADDEAV